MSGKATEPYFVEVDTNGCSKCKAGRTYTVIGPDGYGIGETWERYEDAAKKADELSDAFEFGRLAAYPAPKKGAK